MSSASAKAVSMESVSGGGDGGILKGVAVASHGGSGKVAVGGVADAGSCTPKGSTAEIRLAAVAGFSGVVLSAACIGLGDGLTAGNLAYLHASLAGLFIAARATNKGARGWQAHLARALATMAFAVVASAALKQWSQERSPSVAGKYMVEDTSAGDGGECDLAGEGDDDTTCAEAIMTEGPVDEEWVGALLGWMGDEGGRWAAAVRSGDWREAKLGVVEFWGWASVAAYLALVESLPVLLRPLHSAIRLLERPHNVLLTLTSLAMLAGIVRASISSGKTGSVFAALCTPFDAADPVFRVTSQVFFWSKTWEWFDTALLVAKGKPVTWLHYTHHASTAVLTFLNLVPTPNAIWLVVCASNSFVHAWMYGYYSFPRFGPLRRTRVWITRAQMVQHMLVLASAAYVAYQLHAGTECYNTATPIYAGLGLYAMYLVFFSLFYRRTYAAKRPLPTKTM